MADLQGVGVLVTRPERQAAPLTHLLSAHGARVVSWPVIEIHASPDRYEQAQRLAPLDTFDTVVFTSANAVVHGAPLLGLPRGTIIAIGPATARALAREGLQATPLPTTRFDSEQLLLQPEFRHCLGRRVLIVKGTLGRAFLHDRLTDLGALVDVLEVYERRAVSHSADDLQALAAQFAGGAIDVITATSGDIARGLIDGAKPSLRTAFDRAHWLVPSARVLGVVRELGVDAPVLVAESADDQDLLSAIVRWRSSVSDA